jgi:hypothetical protein
LRFIGIDIASEDEVKKFLGGTKEVGGVEIYELL